MLRWSTAAATCLLLGAGVKGAVVAASEPGEVGPAGQLHSCVPGQNEKCFSGGVQECLKFKSVVSHF